jgi:hypothetical protein
MTEQQWRRASKALTGFCASFLVYLLGVRLGWWPRLFGEDYNIAVGLIILVSGLTIGSNLRKDKPASQEPK